MSDEREYMVTRPDIQRILTRVGRVIHVWSTEEQVAEGRRPLRMTKADAEAFVAESPFQCAIVHFPIGLIQ